MRHTVAVRRPQLQSTFARATVPVGLGILFFVVLGLALWGAAALISGNGEQVTDNLSGSVQDIGGVDNIAAIVAKDGPIVLQDLVGDDDHIVLHHTGDDPQSGWGIHLAHPADRGADCNVEVVRGTQTFTDCDGRTLTVDQLAEVPADVCGPIVSQDGLLSVSLRSCR